MRNYSHDVSHCCVTREKGDCKREVFSTPGDSGSEVLSRSLGEEGQACSSDAHLGASPVCHPVLDCWSCRCVGLACALQGVFVWSYGAEGEGRKAGRRG